MAVSIQESSSIHEYQFSGIYLGRLMVEDAHGNIDFDTVQITVEEPPPAWGGASVVGSTRTMEQGLHLFRNRRLLFV